jgi:uncharacterized membrane protein (DUF373 family)
MKSKRFFENLREEWTFLTFYERFEQIVSLILSMMVVLVILVAVAGVISSIANLNVTQLSTLRGHDFSVVFGSIMSLLIALEFNHTIFNSIQHKGKIVRVKTVVLIAILVIAREFILLDTKTMHGITLFAYAFSVLCLGVVYYILDERERLNPPNHREPE